MKLLFLTNGYPPEHTAGTENYTAGLASSLAAAGNGVTVVCGGQWDAGPAAFNGVRRETLAGVTVLRLDLNWTRGPDPNRSLFDNPLAEARVAQILRDVQPEVVHFTSGYTLSASVLRAVKAQRLPLVVTLTDFWFFCPRVTLLRSDGTLCNGQTTPWECLRCLLGDAKAYRLTARILPQPLVAATLTLASRTPALSRRPGLRGMALDMAARKQTLPTLLNQADRVIAPSQFLADMAQACGLVQTARVLPYGHDLDWVQRLPPRAHGPVLRVGYVGRMTPVKGVHVLLQALAQLSPGLPLETHLFGNLEQEPAYGAHLRTLAADLPLVTFHGRFGRDQMAEVYGQLDVLAVPSLWYENNPLVIQEAFAAGLPVVASRLGGMAEFVSDNVNGLLFEAGDAKSLATALTKLVEQPGLLTRLRQHLPPVRTIEEEVAALSEIYTRLAGERTPAVSS